MNNKFKEEFKKLNAEKIKYIINRCAEHDFLEINKNSNNSFIKYIDDDEYGYWVVEWGYKKIPYNNMFLGCGYFENSIIIKPFKIEFKINNKALYPFNTNGKKQLEDYLFVYINNQCPHYKQAIIEETEKFIKFLDTDNQGENTL